jgi:hypothetical protein
MAGSGRTAGSKSNGKTTPGSASRNGTSNVRGAKKGAAKSGNSKAAARAGDASPASAANTLITGMHDDEIPTPIGVADSLSRTAIETCHQRDRRARLSQLGAPKWEINAAEALVDTCDLALAECVSEFEKQCSKVQVSDSPETRQAASALWLAAREYLRRLSIAEKASRQLTQQHGADKFSDLHLEYELEASALLALKHSSGTYLKLRPDAR